DPAGFAAIVRDAFGQRRKTLRNALARCCDEAAIRAAGLDPQARAEQVPVAGFVRLANVAAAADPPGWRETAFRGAGWPCSRPGEYTARMNEAADYSLEIQIATHFLDDDSAPYD